MPVGDVLIKSLPSINWISGCTRKSLFASIAEGFWSILP